MITSLLQASCKDIQSDCEILAYIYVYHLFQQILVTQPHKITFQGHRTGYVYQNPDLFNRTIQEPKSEARSPATMSSVRFDMLYGDNQTTPSRRAHSRGKGNTYKNRAKWLNTPVKATEYKKEIIQDSHSEPSILKDSRPEKERAVKILEV